MKETLPNGPKDPVDLFGTCAVYDAQNVESGSISLSRLRRSRQILRHISGNFETIHVAILLEFPRNSPARPFAVSPATAPVESDGVINVLSEATCRAFKNDSSILGWCGNLRALRC